MWWSAAADNRFACQSSVRGIHQRHLSRGRTLACRLCCDGGVLCHPIRIVGSNQCKAHVRRAWPIVPDLSLIQTSRASTNPGKLSLNRHFRTLALAFPEEVQNAVPKWCRPSSWKPSPRSGSTISFTCVWVSKSNNK